MECSYCAPMESLLFISSNIPAAQEKWLSSECIYMYRERERERECMYVRLYMVGYGQKVWKSLHQGKEIDQKILLKYIDDLKANSRGPALLSYFRLYSLDITDPIFVLQGVIGQCQRSKDKSMTFNIFLNFHLNLIFYIYFFNFWLELSWFTMSC